MALTRKQYRALELLQMNASFRAPVKLFKDILAPLDEMELIASDGEHYWACYETFVALLEERPEK